MPGRTPIEGFIVLGARVNPQGRPGRVARMRVLHALHLWREQGAQAYVLLTGGKLAGDPVSEAQAMRAFALSWAAENWGPGLTETLSQRLILEEASRNTQASAQNTLPLVMDLNLKTLGLVSDALHLRRALYLFRRHFHRHPVHLRPLPVPGILGHYWQNRRYLWLSKMALRETGAWLKVLGRHALWWRGG